MNLIAAPPEPGKKTPIVEPVLPYFDTSEAVGRRGTYGTGLGISARKLAKHLKEACEASGRLLSR